MYDNFINQWNGRQVTDFGAQCVAGVAEYERQNNLPIVYGDAAQWINNPIITANYDWIQNNPADASQLPQRGDILIYGADLPYTGGAGHICFFDHDLGNDTIMTFGQNSGGPTMHMQPHSFQHVAGWYNLRPLPPPPPPPEPPRAWATAPVSAPDTTQYQVVKLIDGYETSNKAANHIQPPQQPVGAGPYYIFNRRYADSDPSLLVALNVTQVLGQSGTWINVTDNVPDVMPEPVIVVPEPVIIPPSPVVSDWTYKPLTPVEMPVPTPTPELTSKGTVVLPNWRSTYKPFTDQAGSPQPVWYIAQRDFVISDLSTTRPNAPVKEEQRILIAGQFVGPDDLIYGRPQEALYDKAGNVRFWWYGCPMDRDHVLTEKESNRLYDTSITKVEKQALKVIHDIEAIDHKQARQIRQNSLKLEDQLYHSFAKGTNLVTKFMDIITNRSKR